jgi:hypothetical protein
MVQAVTSTPPRPPDACHACGRPIPPALDDLTTRVLRELDRRGPTSGSRIAADMHTRKATVLSSLRDLESLGLVVREQPTPAAGSRRWAAKSARGTDQEPTHAREELADGFTAVSALVAVLGALTASGSWSRRIALGVAVGLVLVLVGALSARSEARHA